jgi:hypothetical protein
MAASTPSKASPTVRAVKTEIGIAAGGDHGVELGDHFLDWEVAQAAGGGWWDESAGRAWRAAPAVLVVDEDQGPALDVHRRIYPGLPPLVRIRSSLFHSCVNSPGERS